jgi:hypothetical protein
MRVVEIGPADTHPLRRAILRNGDPGAPVVYPEDDWPGTVHLGVVDDAGELIATSSWVLKAVDGLPSFAAGRGVQLRGMATVLGRQRSGVGGLLFEEGVARAAAGGAGVVWARARDTAIGFYERHGCRVVGDGYIDATSGLPHHTVVRELPA